MSKYVIQITAVIDVEVEAPTEDFAMDLVKNNTDFCILPGEPLIFVNDMTIDYEIDFSASEIEEDD